MTLLHSTRLDIRVLSLYFTIIDYTLLFPASTSHYYNLYCSTMALLHSTRLYITIPRFYFTLLDSTVLYLGSTSIHYTLLDSTFLYHGSILHYSTMALRHTTLPYQGSTSLYIDLPRISTYLTLHNSTMALLHST